MKRTLFAGCLAVMALLVSCEKKGTDYHLYYLGGQSNMDGYGFVSQLPAELNAPLEGVMIYHGNTSSDNAEPDGRGRWSILTPGHGVGYRSDGDTVILSERFGPELTFASELSHLIPGEKIAIVKYSRGGTSIDPVASHGFGCWYPAWTEGNGVNQYDHFMATVKGSLAVRDIDGDGRNDRLIPSGIVWMQGEADAGDESSALAYRGNLAMIIDSIRSAFGAENMPVVIGRISESHRDGDSIVWTYGDIVRKAQADFVSEDGNAALVTSTDSYKYSDPWHYDTEGYTDLGREFAKAMARLRQP